MQAVIDLRKRGGPQLVIGLPDLEVSARCTSGTTTDVVDRRLAELAGHDDADSVAEVAYLRDVRARLVRGA
jgi:hypothetical protein